MPSASALAGASALSFPGIAVWPGDNHRLFTLLLLARTESLLTHSRPVLDQIVLYPTAYRVAWLSDKMLKVAPFCSRLLMISAHLLMAVTSVRKMRVPDSMDIDMFLNGPLIPMPVFLPDFLEPSNYQHSNPTL